MSSTKTKETVGTCSSTATNTLMDRFMAGDSSVCSTYNEAKREDRTSSLNSAYVTLRSGIKMPLFGLGTWLSGATYDRTKGSVDIKAGREAEDACACALKLGYRLLDTAQMYKNEDQIGNAIRASDVARNQVFVVTKLASGHTKEKSIDALKDSLKAMKLDYVDLFLIHSPRGGNIIDTWRGMLECKKLGLAKSVGVSNFGVAQLKGISDAGLEMPEVNQIELHVWLQQKACRAFMDSNGIATMGYCPLARCKRLEDLEDIAKEKEKSPAQIAIRWSIQSGAITIPKSSKASRIAENADVFSWSLTDEEMKTLGALDVGFKASGSVNAMDLSWSDVK